MYTPMTIKAMKIAYAAHHGQVDRGGIPYIFHPIHLAEQMDDEISCTAALLHDVVEDTDWTLEQLAGEFPAEVIEILSLLTHREAEDYFDYVRRIKGHPIARKIKLADLKHNSDQSRLSCVDFSEEQMLKRLEKYRKAMEILCE